MPRLSPALRELTARVLASQTLARSPGLRSFLRYVVSASASGNSALTEYEIGRKALGRPADYSPNEDNIVRVQARILRQKLEVYFTHEAPFETLRIEIPKGSYVPRFVDTNPAPGSPAELASDGMPPDTLPRAGTIDRYSRLLRRYWRHAGFATLILFVAGVWSWGVFHTSWTHRFWSQVFQPGQTVLVVPSDAGLVVYEAWTRKYVPLSRYSGTDYWRDTELPAGQMSMVNELSKRRLTSITSTHAVMTLMKRPEAQRAQLELRYCRDIKADEIETNSLILIGASESNPWVGLFEDRSAYALDNSPSGFRLLNRSPKPGEPATYAGLATPGNVVYGILSFLPNGKHGKTVLIVQGAGSAGTDAALNFLFDESEFEQFLHKIGRGDHIPYYEALVESLSVAGRAPNARLVAYRLH